MFDTIKDLISPKRFSILAYSCVILHMFIGVVIFTPITASLRESEMVKFSCAVNTNNAPHKTYVEKTCFSMYKDAYNSPVRFNVFVPLSFVSLAIVSIGYSIAVWSRVNKTEIKFRKSTGNEELLTVAEKGNNESGRETFYVFYFYFFHLVLRSLLGILFTILQHATLYPNGFDKQFSCNYPALPETDINETLLHVICENSNASDTDFCGTMVSVCNVIVAVIALAEVIYLVWRRFSRVWSCDSEFIVVYFLRKQYVREEVELTHVDNSSDIYNYKQKVLSISLTLDINYGPNTNFDEMYIDVVIQTEQVPHKFSKGMDRHEIYDAYMKVPKHSIHLKEIKDLFYPNNDTNDEIPRTILALGRPGIGKTVLTRKIMRDWANGIDPFYHGKIAFFYKFRWFNFNEFQNVTLETFLRFGTGLNEDEFKSIFEKISEDSKKAIFIFDGLDEFGGSFREFESYLDQSEIFHSSDPTVTKSAIFLFIKILFGHLLEGCTVLVTSRPTMNGFYTKLNLDRKVEIIGFTEDKIEKYVEQFCAKNSDIDLKPKIWSHISSSSEVKNLCYIPVNCFIVCVTLLECINDHPSKEIGALPTTLTKLYEAALLYFRKHHDQIENNEYEMVMKELEHFAFLGLENERLIFDDESVNEQMKRSGLLNYLPNPIFQIHDQFCFIHLTIQEFLAAKHIAETKDPEDINEFISSHFESGKWHLVLLFLAGLLGRKMRMSVQYRCCVSAFTTHLTSVTKDEHIVCNIDLSQILMMKCLREMDDEAIAKKTAATSALKRVTKIIISVACGIRLSQNDWAAIVFLCKHLYFLTDLLVASMMNLDCLPEVTKLLQERCIKRLLLPDCNLGDLGLQHILDALMGLKCHLSHKHSKLTMLNLLGNRITDAGVIQLCEFLQRGHGDALEELNLKINVITSCGISKLCEALSIEVCNQLTILDLSSNAIGDEGVRILCKVFMEKKFKLAKLYLSKCSLTSACVSFLSEFLSDENCGVTNLLLNDNDVGNEGVGMLSGALRKEQCKLTVLGLSRCSLTDECMPSLCEALADERCLLTKFNLNKNDLTDKHLSLLSDVIKLKHCCLQFLNILGNAISEDGKKLLYGTKESENCKDRGLIIQAG